MPRFASRGGEKLDAALQAFGLALRGTRALDAGASTGGFTDCLLGRGVREVVAVDVAYGQFAWELRNDPRVLLLERTNVRHLTRAETKGPVDVIAADLAFISLTTVADALLGVATDEADLVLLVKPQFELPRRRVPKGGVVRAQEAWSDAMRSVAEAYRQRGCALLGAEPSPLVGPKGNREFFLHLRRAAADASGDLVGDALGRAP